MSAFDRSDRRLRISDAVCSIWSSTPARRTRSSARGMTRDVADPSPPDRRMPASAVLRAAFLLFAAAPLLRAQSGLVRGSVADDAGRPLSVVRVSVVGTTLAPESRSDGTFELRGVPGGTRTVRAQRF